MPIATINGIEVNFVTRGSGEPMLFIHGLGSSARDWRFQLDHFCSRYSVIAYDARGHGDTAKPAGPYSMRLFAQDAKALLDHLAIESCHVIGVSMGGMIAFQLALDNPSAVRSLVIVNSGPDLTPRSIGERIQIWQRFLIVRVLGMRSLARVLAPRLFPDPRQEKLRSQFIDRWSANDKRAYLAAMRAIVGWSVVDRIGEISVPTLFVAAEHDYTPIELKRRFVNLLPNARLEVILDSHHAAPIERPSEVNRAIEAFLRDV